MFTLGGATTSWKSTKQMVIVRSLMEYEFIALDKSGKRLNGYATSYRTFQDGQNLYLQYAYTMIVNLLLVEHKTVCIMVSLDTFVIYIITLYNYSQLGLSL